jgi:hypothetical protein
LPTLSYKRNTLILLENKRPATAVRTPRQA